MFQLPSPSSLISPESVPSTMCPMSSQVEWDEQVEGWSVDNGEEEEEVSNDSITKECADGKEVSEDFEERVEEPKKGMEFDTHDEAYLYYSRFAKEKGFAVAKRSSKKGKDGMLKHVILQCTRGGKPRPRGSNPAKARPQSKVECPAHLNVMRTEEGKWRVSRVLLEHNHEQSPSKSRFFKSNRVLDSSVKKILVLHDDAGIRLNKTIASLHIEAGGPDKVPYLPRDCRNYLDKEIEDVAVPNVVGTQESVANVNNYPSYMGPLMWQNMMAHNMRPSMFHGANQPQVMHNFGSSQSFMHSSQTFMPSGFNNQVWGGPQSMLMEAQHQGQPSFVQLMDATNNTQE